MTQNEGQEKLAIAFQRSLAALGIDMSIRTVDDAQYQQRSQTFDYDMIMKAFSSSLSPGAEQINRWGSASRDTARALSISPARPARQSMRPSMPCSMPAPRTISAPPSAPLTASFCPGIMSFRLSTWASPGSRIAAGSPSPMASPALRLLPAGVVGQHRGTGHNIELADVARKVIP
jgi:hypothetical protein